MGKVLFMASWSTRAAGRRAPGDSAAFSASLHLKARKPRDVMRQQVQEPVFELQVRGPMNVQSAVKNNALPD